MTVENVQQLFAEEHVPGEPDVLSIDVDGNNYWIWQAIRDYAARLVVIELRAANHYLAAGSHPAHPQPARAIIDMDRR